MSDRHIPNVLSPYSGSYATREERHDHAEGLRALADWLEKTEFPVTRTSLTYRVFDETIECYSSSFDDEGFVKRVGSAARLIGGRVEKGEKPYSNDYCLTRDFGGGVKFRYTLSRNAVCTSREETVEEERFVAVDSDRDAELEAEIERLKAQREELEKERRRVPIRKVVFDCPLALLPAEKETVETPAVSDVNTEGIPF